VCWERQRKKPLEGAQGDSCRKVMRKSVEPLIWRIAGEIKIEEFQAQLFFASNINFVINMLKIGFDGSLCNPHLKGYLVVLASLASQIRDLSLTGRK
jgi:hypothetical protein